MAAQSKAVFQHFTAVKEITVISIWKHDFQVELASEVRRRKRLLVWILQWIVDYRRVLCQQMACLFAKNPQALWRVNRHEIFPSGDFNGSIGKHCEDISCITRDLCMFKKDSVATLQTLSICPPNDFIAFKARDRAYQEKDLDFLRQGPREIQIASFFALLTPVAS